MINFGLHQFALGRQLLLQEVHQARVQAARYPLENVPASHAARIQSNINSVIAWCVVPLKLEALNRLSVRLENITGSYIAQPYQWTLLRDLLDRFIEDLDYESNQELFFHYSRDSVRRVRDAEEEWKSIFARFPSARSEVLSGIDCLCLEHYAASVFHMMRVAELGIRALARERRVAFPDKPMEWAMWEQIIDQIASKGSAAADAIPKGPQRDAARAFYADAISHLKSIKEVRNRTMHYRGTFDQYDAMRTIDRVRDLMLGLSLKIGEKTRRPIGKWP